MKKSEIYKMAQKAVLDCPMLATSTKLEVLRELIEREDSALYWESQEEKEDAHEAI